MAGGMWRAAHSATSRAVEAAIEATTVRSMTTTLLQRENGSAVALCSPACFASWRISNPEQGMRLRKASDNLRVCLTCAECGVLAHEPASCLLHERHCPPARWEYTRRAAAVLGAFSTRTGMAHAVDDDVVYAGLAADIELPDAEPDAVVVLMLTKLGL